MRDKTRKHLRATLATTCALSLAASLAFPLAALAQAPDSDEAVPQPVTATMIADPTTEEAITASAATEVIAVAEPLTTDTPTMESALPDASSSEQASVSQQATDESVAAEVALIDELSIVNGAASISLEDVEPQANTANNATSLETGVSAGSSAVPTQVVEKDAGKYVSVFFSLSPPREFASIESNVSLYCSVPLGMSFQEARQQDSLKGPSQRDEDYFFNLGTEQPIEVGDVHPEIPGYTFAGWVFPGECTVVDATTPIVERANGLYKLVGSWKKDGSNVVSSTGELLGGLHVVAAGMLSGENAPAGADMRVVSNSVISTSYYFNFLNEAERNIVDVNKFHAMSVDLFVDGKQVHDKFGSMKLTFYDSDGFSEGATVRVWHKHLDGTVTHEDVKPVGDTVSVTVTDLSTFAYAELGKDPNQTQPGDDQKPGGNQGTQQPGGSNGGNGNGNNGGGNGEDDGNGGDAGGNNDNGDKKDDGNKNDNGDKKTDDGKQGGSGDKGSNNKNTGNLAKTGDEMRYALGGTMAAITIALFTGGTALLMGNRKRPAHRRR